MSKAPVGRATAKEELSRLNDYLKQPLLLIGGLAVQQYENSRVSVDLDLICDFDLIQQILRDLYPSKEWSVENRTEDDIRPAYHIKNRDGRPDEIIFGPKVVQRGEYPHLRWTELENGAKPFRLQRRPLDRILVPTPHALAYSKLVSFATRRSELVAKIRQDAEDLANLSNHRDFILSDFWDFIRRNDPHGVLIEAFRAKAVDYQAPLSQSCLHSIAEIVRPASAAQSASAQQGSAPRIYIAAPHKNVEKNSGVAETLRKRGLVVRVPLEEVERVGVVESPDNAKQIRSICMQSIDWAEIVAVDLDAYGLDTAWELGYAEGLGKKIVGYNLVPSCANDPQPIQRRPYHENFMHGWGDTLAYQDIPPLAHYCTNKTVYLCGSFTNGEIARLSASPLAKSAKRLVVPSQHLSGKSSLPREYPLKDREHTNKLLADSDLVVVILPRYGMDASWQIGYATALGKPVVGILRRDDKRAVVNQSFWDHWMHSWKTKTHLTSIRDLGDFLSAYRPE